MRSPFQLLRLAFFLLLAVANTALAQAPADAKPAPLKILFIGNGVTFKEGMPAALAEMAATASEPRPIDVRVVWFDAATLQTHWDKGEAAKAIDQGPWDFVVLQEHSHVPVNQPEQMYRYMRLFDAAIRKAGARTLIFQPWAWNERYETIVPIEATTRKIATELGAQLVPVGAAWKIVQKDYPRLPLLNERAVPTVTATYLNASVFYSVIFQKKAERPRELAVGLNGIDAAALRGVAWEVAQAAR
jgi:hypothetical protein